MMASTDSMDVNFPSKTFLRWSFATFTSSQALLIRLCIYWVLEWWKFASKTFTLKAYIKSTIEIQLETPERHTPTNVFKGPLRYSLPQAFGKWKYIIFLIATKPYWLHVLPIFWWNVLFDSFFSHPCFNWERYCNLCYDYCFPCLFFRLTLLWRKSVALALTTIETFLALCDDR